MSVNFNNDGTKILALGRRQPVVLYNIHSPVKVFEFDHPGNFKQLLTLDGHIIFVNTGGLEYQTRSDYGWTKMVRLASLLQSQSFENRTFKMVVCLDRL